MTDRGLIQREGRTKKGGEELEFSRTEERERERVWNVGGEGMKGNFAQQLWSTLAIVSLFCN
jgi:hypothetical protein